MVSYPDGSQKPFGKSLKARGVTYGDAEMKKKHNREFVYYGGRTNGPTQNKLKK